jgi:hypothetical protein
LSWVSRSPPLFSFTGPWADGSSWNKVIPFLLAKDLSVIAVQNSLTSVEDDAAATSRIIADIDGPVVLVGHSGAVWPSPRQATTRRVVTLVYVSAFAPDVGETGSSLIGTHPAPPALSSIVTDSAGFVYQSEEGVVKNIAPDVPLAEVRGQPRRRTILEPVARHGRRVRSVWTRPDKVAEDSDTKAPGREGVTKTDDRIWFEVMPSTVPKTVSPLCSRTVSPRMRPNSRISSRPSLRSRSPSASAWGAF